MDFLTIVGYIIAALAIASGLYLMLRKNAADENTTTTTEQLLLDDNDSNTSHQQGRARIPVVPRHVRDQIGSQETPNRQAIPAAGLAKDDADELLAEAPAIKADRHAEVLNQDVHDDLNRNSTDAAQSTETAKSPVLAQQGQALAESSKPDQDPVEDTFDQALAQLEAATSTDESAPDTPAGQNIASSDPDTTASSKTGTDALATADVEEWQGESALLDAHLEDQERRDDESALAQAEHIVALYVMPDASRTLSGERTIQLLRQFGLRYGEMSLFHRFQDSDGTGPLMFSVLRYTSEGPSGFDLETLPGEQVEGLAFFLALPSRHAVAGYDTMVSISTLLAREIHGQVYDEHMNQLSPQLREHYRHFVLEYRTPA